MTILTLEVDTAAGADILDLSGMVSEKVTEAGGSAGWLTPLIDAILFIGVLKNGKACISWESI